jgi:hypothetical protein
MRESAMRDLCDKISMDNDLVFQWMFVRLTVVHRSVPSNFVSKRSQVGL